MSKLDRFIGVTFNRLTVVEMVDKRHGKYRFRCVCSCGREAVTYDFKLTSGRASSCGCAKQERFLATIFSGRKDRMLSVPSAGPEYGVWRTMIQRCHLLTSKGYRNYGARGIYVCDRWRHGEDGKTGYECFINDMGRRPAPRLQIDRRDNDGPYSPENCRWVTASENLRNRPPRKTRRWRLVPPVSVIR